MKTAEKLDKLIENLNQLKTDGFGYLTLLKDSIILAGEIKQISQPSEVSDCDHCSKSPYSKETVMRSDEEIKKWADELYADSERYDFDYGKCLGRIDGAKAMRDGQIKPTIEGEKPSSDILLDNKEYD